MKQENDRYTFRVTWSEEDEAYVGRCTEFPSLSWLAETREKAIKGMGQLVAEVMADMRENGEQLPTPLSLQKYSGKFMVRIPPELHRRLAEEAAEERVSINRLVSARLAR